MYFGRLQYLRMLQVHVHRAIHRALNALAQQPIIVWLVLLAQHRLDTDALRVDALMEQ